MIRHLKRYFNLFFNNEDLSIDEKIKIVFSSARNETLQKIFLNRLVKTSDQKPYFLVNGFKVLFQPNFKISDEEYFLKGITQVLIETFIFPEYFSLNVKLSNGDVVLDLGTSIGTVTLLFSRLVGKNGRVYAFEPVTDNIIQDNIKLNAVNNVIVIPKCVSDVNGKGEIEISDFCLDSSIVKREYTKGYYKLKKSVDFVTLDSFVESSGLNRIDFIKMDIEGAEELAIEGAAELINKYHPKWSISSYHIDFRNKPQHDILVSLLRDKGYKIKEVNKHHIYAW